MWVEMSEVGKNYLKENHFDPPLISSIYLDCDFHMYVGGANLEGFIGG